MEHVEIGPIGSDQGLLAHLHLNPKGAQNFLYGRVPLRKLRTRNLRWRDIVELRVVARSLGRPVEHEDAIVEYVRSRHGPVAADCLQKAFDLLNAPLHLETVQEFWVILSDVEHLIDERKAEFIWDVLEAPGAVTFFTGGPFEARRLKAFIGMEVIIEKMPLITFRQGNIIGALGSMVLGNPLSSHAKTYLIGEEGLLLHPMMKLGKGYAEHLREKTY